MSDRGVYAVPSQTRNAKAHIVRSVPIDLCISVPNSFAVEAEELMAMAQGPTKMFRTALLLKSLAERKEAMMEQYECSCEGFTYRHVPCKHMLAVSMARATGRVV